MEKLKVNHKNQEPKIERLGHIEVKRKRQKVKRIGYIQVKGKKHGHKSKNDSRKKG